MKNLIQLKKDIKDWVGHFIWFMKESKDFMSEDYIYIILHGGVFKGISHANFMVKYNKMTKEQKKLWYLNENRVLYFDKIKKKIICS